MIMSQVEILLGSANGSGYASMPAAFFSAQCIHSRIDDAGIMNDHVWVFVSDFGLGAL